MKYVIHTLSAVVSVALLTGCQQHAAAPLYQRLDSLRQEKRDLLAGMVDRERQELRKVALPKNYKLLIDAKLVETLRDPDSRRVEYGKTPYGGLACGTVNARNAYGGYTGKQPFFVWFDKSGKIKRLEVVSDTEMNEAQMAKINGDPATIVYDMLSDCGQIA